MKLRTSTPQQISEYIEMNKEFDEEFKKNGVGIEIAIPTQLKKPNPPTPEMVERAQFIDKTYFWKHAGVRLGDERSSK